MANNDELIARAEHLDPILWSTYRWHAPLKLIRDLATALRAADQRIAELERDRERLDWLETCQSITTGRDGGYQIIGVCRSNIDAAMSGERGE